MKVPTPELPRVAPQMPELMRPISAGTAGYEKLQRGLADVGQAADQAVGGAVELYQREKHKATVADANDALTKLQQQDTELKFGGPATPDDNPDAKVINVPPPPGMAAEQNGFFSARGKTASEVSSKVLEEWKKRRDKIAGDLTSPESQRIFQVESDKMYQTFFREVESHVARERERSYVDSAERRKTVALNAIANNYSDPELVRQQVAGVVGPMSVLLPAEEAKAQENAFLAEVAKVRLNQFVAAKDDKGAEALYAQVKSQLGVEAPHYEHVIGTLREKKDGERTAISVVDSAREASGFVNPATAIARFQALPEAQRGEEAQQAFSKWLQLEGAKKKAAVDSNYDAALSQYLDKHSLSDVEPATQAWLKEVDPESWHRLEQIQRADAQHARGQPATASQERALAQFRLWAADNPDQAAQMSAEEFNRSWSPLLARADRDNAIAVLSSYHAYANKPEKMANAIDAAVQEVGGRGGAGVLPTDKRNKADWAPDELDVYARVTAKVQQKANEFRRSSGGKEPTVDDLRGWAKDEFLQGKNPEGGFLGFGGNTTRVEAEIKGTGFEPKFGADEKAKAAEALKAAGARVDDAAVENYLRRKNKLPALPIQAKPAVSPTEVVPGQWGLDLTPPVTTKTIDDLKSKGL